MGRGVGWRRIAVGDLGEFWYGDYKEPFEQLEGAVPGFPKGVVLAADDGKLLCAFCGKTFTSLAGHVRTHGLTARTYKIETGLLQKTALVSERTRARMVGHGRGGPMPAWLKASSHEGAKPNGERYKRVAVGPSAHGGQLTAERLNKTGRCYVQTLTVARALAAHGRLTKKALSAAGIGEMTIRRYFGSIVNLRAQLDSPLPGDEGNRGAGYEDSRLLAALRSLAAEIGRTPAVSDLKRFGLPIEETYRRHFGTYTKACQAAGLDPNLPGQYRRGEADDVTVLVAYATHANINKAARQLGLGPYRVMEVLARYGCPRPRRRNDTTERRAWAGDMARRLADWPEAASA